MKDNKIDSSETKSTSLKKKSNRKRVTFKTKKGKTVSFSANKNKKKSSSPKSSSVTTRTSKKKITRTDKIKIEYVKQNNKTRKGEYVYIKEKGKRPKYYKKKEGLSKADYLYAYKHNVQVRRGGIKKEKIKKEKKIDSLYKKYPKVEDVLTSGIAQYTVTQAKGLTPQGIKVAYMNLLENKDRYKEGIPVVRDGLLRDLLTRPDIVEKWKFRVMFEIDIEGEKGDKMVTIKNQNVKTLANIKHEIVDKIKIGEDWESQYRSIAGSCENHNYSINGNGFDKGKVSKVSIRMTYRK